MRQIPMIGMMAIGAATLTAFCGIQSPAFAEFASSGPTAAPITQNNPVTQNKPVTPKPTQYTLGKTQLQTGFTGATSTAGGFTNVDSPVTIVCAAKACTIEVKATVQVGPTSAGGQWAILTTLDDGYLGTGGPWLGELPTDGTYVQSTAITYGSVAKGTHTLQTQVATANAAGVANYTTEYALYSP